MSNADLRDVNGNRRGDRASGVPMPPGVTSQDEPKQAVADAVQPDLANVEAVLRAVAELPGTPPAPVDHNEQTARSFLRRQPVRIVDGRIEGGYTDAFEVICCDAAMIPTWTTSRFRPGFSGSAGLTRCTRARSI